MVVGIPPDISYGLQCGVEGFDITEDVITFYYEFNDKVNLAELSDNYQHSDDGVQTPISIRDSLQRFARDVYYQPYNNWFETKASVDQRSWCLAMAGNSFGRKAAEMIDYKLSRYISDMLANEADPYRVENQSKWLAGNRGFNHHVLMADMLAEKLTSVPMDNLLHALHHPDDFYLRFPKVISPPVSTTTRDAVSYLIDEAYVDADSLPKYNIKSQRKKQRKILSKSANFLKSLVGKETASLLIGGSEVKIEGRRFIFSIKVNMLYANNHGALDISILEKKTGDYLCKLCWYVDQTPALDQVSALILAVQTNNEDEVIRIGNAFSGKHESIIKHTHIHDVITPSDPCRDMGDFFGGNLNHDRMLSLTDGTTAFRENNPNLFFAFSDQCVSRLCSKFHTDLPSFQIKSPDTVREFLPDGTVSRELLFDEGR